MRGPNIIRCYWNKPEATAEVIVDGWLASGDLGRIDEEGFLYIEDRAKDMVLRAGENVYCAEVESAIYEHGDVYEAAVFGVPHERLGEEVACVILRQPGSDLDADALQDFLAESVAPFKVPSRIAFADEQLPRNASGKILKRAPARHVLRHRLLRRRQAGGAPGGKRKPWTSDRAMASAPAPASARKIRPSSSRDTHPWTAAHITWAIWTASPSGTAPASMARRATATSASKDMAADQAASTEGSKPGTASRNMSR